MLLEFLDRPVCIDHVPVMQNFRLNLLPDKHQLRMKAEFLSTDGQDPKPIDIVVYQYTNPKLEKLSLAISITGEEMQRHMQFQVKLSFDFLKRKWKLIGSVGRTQVNREMSSAIEILQVIQDLI